MRPDICPSFPITELNQFIANQRTRFNKNNGSAQHPPMSVEEEIELVKTIIASMDPSSSDGQEFAVPEELSKKCLAAFESQGLHIRRSSEQYRDRQAHYIFFFLGASSPHS